MPPQPYFVLDPRNPNPRGTFRPSTPLPNHVRHFGHLPDASQILPGDLLLGHALNPLFISRAIIHAQTNGGHHQDDAKWHHAAVYIGDYQICEAQILGGVRITYLYDYISTHELRIRRDLSLQLNDRWKIAVYALSRLGESYGLKALPGLWWQSRIGFWHPFQRYGDARAIVCSQLYSDSYTLASNKLLVQGKTGLATPADLSLTNVLTDVQINWIRLI